jgi:uncharacterized protein (TIGR03083 family)
MTSTADVLIDALAQSHDDLVGFIAGFKAADLTHASACSKWDVSQVLSHLGSGAEISLATLEGGLGTAEPPTQDFYQGVWARWDAMAPEARAEGFVESDGRLVRRCQGLDPTTRAELRVDLPFLPAPADLATVTGLRLSEVTFHAWDVKVAFRPETTLLPVGTELGLDQIGLFVRMLGRADALGGQPVGLTVETSEPARRFGLRIGDSAELSDAPESPDGVLQAPAEAWLRLVAGRLPPERTPTSVDLTSEAVTLDDLRRVFPGF